MIKTAFYSDPNKLDVRPWFRSDISAMLNAMMLSIQALPAEQRLAAENTLFIIAVQCGIDVISVQSDVTP